MEVKIEQFRNNSCNFIFLLYLIGLLFVPIDLNITTKIINATGAFSLFLLIVNKKHNYNKNVIILILGLLLLGAMNLIWYEFYKTEDVVYRNAYRGYLESGKLLVFSSLTFLLLSKNKFRQNEKLHFISAILVQIIMLCRAYYQGIYLHADRIPLSAMNGNIGQMGAATIAAYVITFTTLYSSIVFIKMQSRYKWFLFYANFALSFAAVMMTGTRAAIFTFPLMIMVILFLQHRDQKVFLFKGLSGVFILLLACGLIFNKEIDRRINSLKADVISYATKNNSQSSVGARFAMVNAGIKGSPDGFNWQSLEQRAEKIKALSAENNIYSGALLFLDVHMHNEIVESLSTKGKIGLLVLIMFYVAMIYYCIREKKYILLVFPASIMLFGISDVITHAKPIPASWIVCLFLSISFLSKNEPQ
ncbi:O-antigen ligase family protein [Escherichia coli]|nr:O-antigen ligase family protein [Escherichia coli]EME7712756.1 O-antigen ligase family protein [Escherichia coli]EME7729478.1 O-antigen ligase family protein [Escherichia coli]EMF1870334.1 O-antigen ligase family protein [Escherichia coli]